jgi:hypothetical protein
MNGRVNGTVKIDPSLPNFIQPGMRGVVGHPQVIVERQGQHAGALIKDRTENPNVARTLGSHRDETGENRKNHGSVLP